MRNEREALLIPVTQYQVAAEQDHTVRKEMLNVTLRTGGSPLPNMLAVAVAILLFGHNILHAQAKVGGNPQSMHPSAALEVESANRGFLPPRVALTSITDAATIPAPAEGLLVYNNGSGALKEKGYYYWNGTQWTAIGGFSSTSDGAMRIGETRAAVIPVNINLFPAGALGPVFRTWMNGRFANNTVLGNYLLYSDVADINQFIVFEGLRMDFSSGGYGGAEYRAPKLVNTTNANILVSLTAQSTGLGDRQVNMGYMMLAPNAVCWEVDGNDGFAVSENDFIEYIDAVIYVHNQQTGAVRMYRASWSMAHVNEGNGRNRLIAGFSVTRHS
jgi:hypothetical protein